MIEHVNRSLKIFKILSSRYRNREHLIFVKTLILAPDF